MANSTLSDYGLTPLGSPTQGGDPTAAGGPLDLLGSGTTPTQPYDPFQMDPSFGGSTFTLDNTKQTTTHLIPGGGSAVEPGDRPKITETKNVPDTRAVNDFLKGLADNPAALKSLQYTLVGAGFNIDVTGTMDDKTMSTLGNLINEAQRGKLSLMDVIDAHAKAQKSAAGRKILSPADLHAQAENAMRSQLVSAYVSWWGVAPSETWIRQALASGQNLFEIEFAEKSKPSYANSPTYQQNHNSIENSLSQGPLSTQTFTGGGNSFSPGPAA